MEFELRGDLATRVNVERNRSSKRFAGKGDPEGRYREFGEDPSATEHITSSVFIVHVRGDERITLPNNTVQYFP